MDKSNDYTPDIEVFRLVWGTITEEIATDAQLCWVAAWCQAVEWRDANSTKDMAQLALFGVKPLNNVAALEDWLEMQFDGFSTQNDCPEQALVEMFNWIDTTFHN